MIKLENIEFTIGESEYSGDLKVPSVVLTSTPQEEKLDLTKTPNFQITINDNGELTDTVEVSFDVEWVTYTANMKVVNRNGDFVTLQYVDGLIALHTYSVIGPAELCGTDWDPTDTSNVMGLINESNNIVEWAPPPHHITNPNDMQFRIVQDYSLDNAWPTDGNYNLRWDKPGYYWLIIRFNIETKEITTEYEYSENPM